jgi:hypothetical protein
MIFFIKKMQRTSNLIKIKNKEILKEEWSALNQKITTKKCIEPSLKNCNLKSKKKVNLKC